MNAGGLQYADTDGAVYLADAKFSGGATYKTTATIAGTTDPYLYQTERYGNFSYAIPVANGNYDVTFKFAEIYWSSAGQRAFNVSMEGKTVLSNLDLVAEARPKAAYDVKIPVSVTDGVLNMTFTSVVGDAQVNGMVVTAKQVALG